MEGLKKSIIMVIFSLFAIFSSFAANTETMTAIVAGGCFWCVQADFDKVTGVLKTTAGYTGGSIANPSYEQVSNGSTGHYEAVEIVFDPKIINYPQLLNVFWHNVDPTNANGQFCDNGNQYRAVIFYLNNQQKKLAEQSRSELIKSNRFKHVVTEILPAKTFYPAEEYHQQYYLKNPVRYKFYRYTCGRDKRLHEVWD